MAVLSLNELEALCRKAARGAGLSWGLAEEAGKAVRWLTTHQLQGAPALARMLQSADFASSLGGIDSAGGRWISNGKCLNSISAGASISDHARLITDSGEITLHDVLEPLLLVPFLSRAAALNGHDLLLDFEIASVLASPAESFVIDGEIPQTAARAAVRICQETGAWQGPTTVLEAQEIDATTLEQLEALAFLTYAPSTESSRLAGAGAGLSDND